MNNRSMDLSLQLPVRIEHQVQFPYTKDHSSLMADKMLVFFNSDFAYAVNIKYITAKTTTNASRNSHGNTNVMQWFTASNRLQTITLKMLPNTRAITNEPPR